MLKENIVQMTEKHENFMILPIWMKNITSVIKIEHLGRMSDVHESKSFIGNIFQFDLALASQLN